VRQVLVEGVTFIPLGVTEAGSDGTPVDTELDRVGSYRLARQSPWN
jgi:hypothetical protein